MQTVKLRAYIFIIMVILLPLKTLSLNTLFLPPMYSLSDTKVWKLCPWMKKQPSRAQYYVQKVDNAICWINVYPVGIVQWIVIYPADNAIQFWNNWGLYLAYETPHTSFIWEKRFEGLVVRWDATLIWGNTVRFLCLQIHVGEHNNLLLCATFVKIMTIIIW